MWSRLIAALCIANLVGCETPLSEVEVMGTLERDRIELAADTNEPITQILVGEGDPVTLGQALLTQATVRVEAALARARAEEATALAALAEAEKGPRAQAIQQARARLVAATSAAETARHELERQKSLVARNFSSESTVSIMQGRYDEAMARRDEAAAALDELLEGTRNELIDQARSRYAAARANVQELQITLARATVTSPVDGRVEVLPFELGERPAPGAAVAVLLASSPVYARVHIPTALRAHATPGTPALVHIDGYESPFAATVRWVSADASFTPYFALTQHDRSRLSFLAEIDLQSDANESLPAGIPVQVTFPGLAP